MKQLRKSSYITKFFGGLPDHQRGGEVVGVGILAYQRFRVRFRLAIFHFLSVERNCDDSEKSVAKMASTVDERDTSVHVQRRLGMM